MSNDKPPSNSHPQQKSFIDRIGHFISGEPQDQNDLLDVLKEAQKNRLLDIDTLSMIESVLQFSDRRVKDIMIPRVQMNTVDKDAKIADVCPLVLEHGHSRFPVIEDDRSKVVGVLLAKDLLAQVVEKKELTVADIMRPVSVVPESKRLNALLNEFRTERDHMAIVVDEYGMAAGLVTIEDVLEQIVGKIEDEHDTQSEEEEYIKKNDETRYTVKAITSIDDINDYFSSNLVDDEHETIGGFVVHQLGYMPKKGDSLEYGDFRFEILHADNRRVYLLKLKLLNKKGKVKH
jgi:magnesium and cobalt transporter